MSDCHQGGHAFIRQPVGEKGGPDIVGKVGDDARRSAAQERTRIEPNRVGLDDLEALRVTSGDLGESRQAARIALDGDHPFRALSEKRARQAARTRADLDDGDAGERPARPRDARGQVEVEQEVLAERFLRREPVALHDLPQRRQRIDAAHRAASRAASCRAAMRLVGRAMPCPAMSKAVPWSGEVRTKGSPSVTLTASSKAIVLIGTRAWS